MQESHLLSLQRLRCYAEITGIDFDTIKLYFESRKPYPRKHNRPRRAAYQYQCPAISAFQKAKWTTAINRQWQRLEDLNMVRLRFVPDEMSSYEDMCGDTFNIEMNADSVPGGARTILAEEKTFKRKLELDGIWGCIGEFTLDNCEGYSRCKKPDTYGRRSEHCDCGATWHHGGSLFALEGTDDYGYQSDIKAETIDALKTALRNRPVISAPSRLRKATVTS